MSLGLEKQVICEPDGSVAIISHLPATTIFGEKISLDDVIAILRAHGIMSHIDTMGLEIAVERSNKTGDPIENIIAARAQVSSDIIFEEMERVELKDFLSEIDSARKAYEMMVGGISDVGDDFKVRFVEEGKVVLQISEPEDEDIYGKKIKKRKIPVELRRGEGISEYNALGVRRFTAESTGYLVVDDKMRLSIISPFVVSEDKMKLIFSILPLRRKEQIRPLMTILTSQFNERVIGNQMKIDLYSVIERVQLLIESGDVAEHLLLAQGKEPTTGKDAVVKILAGSERQQHSGESTISDQMKQAQYCMVSQGEVLAEVTPAIPGDQGMNVLGTVLEPLSGKARDVIVGQNIKKDVTQDKIFYVAAKAGCFVCNNLSISVSDTLTINGDVGPRTGNIVQGASVIVNGNILPGFSVECKEDLIVNGSIENGAMVKCNGLIVRKGVFTRKGMVMVKSDADIGYIQDAVIRVNGKLVVQRYIHNSRVTVRGDLVVYGRGVQGHDRGAVMGSRVSVLGNSIFHSLGNENEDTVIMGGCDQDLQEQLLRSQTVMSSIQTDISMLQNQIGVDLTAADAAEVLKRLPQVQKDIIAEKLKKIKSLLADLKLYQSKYIELTEKTYASDLEAITINIQGHVIPKTTLAIGADSYAVNKRTGGGVVRLVKGVVSFSGSV